MNIVDLLQADGIEPEHASGDEWHSCCPECGGTDRLSSWPNMVNSNGFYGGGRFVCRQCRVSGDAVSYLKKRHGMTFQDACTKLNVEPGPAPERQYRKPQWEPQAPKPEPGREWQAKAAAFLESSQRALWNNQAALRWLHDERGLTHQTIKAAGLGWNGQDAWENRDDWGLSAEVNPKTGKPKRVWIPEGLIIPFVQGERVVRLRIRRTKSDSYGRYVVVADSGMAPMTIRQNQRNIVVVESELDALLLMQECGNICGCIALGSAQQKPDKEMDAQLMKAERLLCCLDSDSAGADASWRFWKRYPNFKRWGCMGCKDVTEMWKRDVPVREWILAGIGMMQENKPEMEVVENPPLFLPPAPMAFKPDPFCLVNPAFIQHCRFLQEIACGGEYAESYLSFRLRTFMNLGMTIPQAEEMALWSWVGEGV